MKSSKWRGREREKEPFQTIALILGGLFRRVFGIGTLWPRASVHRRRFTEGLWRHYHQCLALRVHVLFLFIWPLIGQEEGEGDWTWEGGVVDFSSMHFLKKWYISNRSSVNMDMPPSCHPRNYSVSATLEVIKERRRKVKKRRKKTDTDLFGLCSLSIKKKMA